MGVSTLRATATSFIPGAIKHVIKKVHWHPLGITNCKWFEVVPNEATIRGRKSSFNRGLHKTHGTEDPYCLRNSKVRDANPEGAAPFKIPPTPYENIIKEEESDPCIMPKNDMPTLIRQKSYTKLNISDACISLRNKGLNRFNAWSINDYREWIDKSEPMIPGVRPKPPCELAPLDRINTIKGVPVPSKSIVNESPKRHNYCDN